MIQQISGFSAFSNSAWTPGSSKFMYYWSIAWRILSIILLVCEMSAIVWYCEHCLALPFFDIEMKGDLFQSCGHCWIFQICWRIECSTLTASSFRIWNSSAEIPSPPLALLVLMLLKAHLASHSRMSASRWVTTPSWLSGSWRSFLYSSSVYSCLESPMDGGAWWAAVHGVAKSWTRLSDLTFTFTFLCILATSS